MTNWQDKVMFFPPPAQERKGDGQPMYPDKFPELVTTNTAPAEPTLDLAALQRAKEMFDRCIPPDPMIPLTDCWEMGPQLVKNLKNVSAPGTNIALGLFVGIKFCVDPEMPEDEIRCVNYRNGVREVVQVVKLVPEERNEAL